ncbi:MAG: glutathione S-transferase family protein [Nannocystales bacterium]
MKLYWGSGSPYAWRAMLALIIKGVEFEDELLEFSKKQHKTPEYLALSPRGKVPALVDGETVVTESLAILTYIDRKVPNPPLFGETAAETARIAQRFYEHESYVGKVAGEVMAPLFRGQASERADHIRERAQVMHEEFAAFDRLLESSPWLAGERISAVDIVFYPTACLIDRMAARPEVAELDLGVSTLAHAHPRLADFKRRFAALPGVDRAHPPHWAR